MKPLAFLPPNRPAHRPRPAGVALVLVLSFLVIISGLIIAFFSMVTTEASSASTTAAAASAKTLADSAVSFVMGTIVDATSGRDPNDPDPTHSGPRYAWVWASQPGMIRTYDNTGVPKFVYKLYSADQMKLTSAAPLTTETAGLTQWATGGAKDVWVDMNEPVKVQNGAVVEDVYPIVDPRAAEDFDATSFPGHEEDIKAQDHKVAGFHVLKAGAFAEGKDPNAPNYDANNNNPAPMPVKWLYVLQDGTMTTASQSGGVVTLNGSAASVTNPIKGRIAFWTDDESSKVNINTASQGTYWDTPRVMSDNDGGALLTPFLNANGPQSAIGTSGLALDQPAKGEFQRYPGHPGTVSLSEIFGFKGTPVTGKNLKPVLPVPTPSPGYVYTTADVANIQKYYALTPRILSGGSKAGTSVPPTTLPPTDTQGKVIQPSQGGYWRLYSAVDELLYDALAPANNDADQFHRIPNLFSALGGRKVGAVPYEMMQKAKFFLTANSSAPEVTLYNTPRVSMWPVNDTNLIAPQRGIKLQRTPYDELAKFCATVGAGNNSYPFYFTRFNSRDQTADYQTFPQNIALYKYLQALTSLPVPGANGNNSFAGKYQTATAGGASDRDQILTCIYDYIRCTNMQDSTVNPDPAHSPVVNPLDPLAYPYRYTPVSTVNGTQAGNTDNYIPGAGEIMPIKIGNTQGFGRFDTAGSAYLLFFPAHGYRYGNEPVASNPAHFIPTPSDTSAPEAQSTTNAVTDAMGVVFMLSFYNPMQGNVGNHQKMCYRVGGLDKLNFTPGPFTDKTGTPVASPAQVPWQGSDGGGSTAGPTVFPAGQHWNYVLQGDVRTWHGRGIGGTVSPIMAFMNGLWGPTSASSQVQKFLNKNNASSPKSSQPDNYPFYAYTNQIPVPPQNSSNTADPVNNVYYPTKFKIDQTAGPANDIIVELFTAEQADAGFPTTSTPIQTIHFRFPPAILRIPPIINGSSSLITSYANNSTRLFYQGTSSTATTPKFFFNDRIQFFGGSDPSGNTDTFIMPTDTVVSLEPAGPGNNGATSTVDHTAGDQRMYAALGNVDSKYFQPNFSYGQGGVNFASTAVAPQFAHNMSRSVSSSTFAYKGLNPVNNTFKGFNMGKLINSNIQYSRTPDVPRRVGGSSPADTTGANSFVTRSDGGQGSWDTGIGLHKDGAYINKPDEGDQNFYRFDNPPPQPNPQYRIPYIYKDDYFGNSGSYFSPNRQIPSSMMLGSIPTGIQHFLPWQTLLFHYPFNDTGHPGLQAPADHYMADLFWIPVVEPYAISQPFSTSGKINMNYQIQPFTYIKRTTAMRALMASIKMPIIASTLIDRYKPTFGEASNVPRVPDIRFPINLDATMTMLDRRFVTDNDIYRSATEISTVPLIPRDNAIFLSGTETYGALIAKMNAYWGSGLSLTNAHQLTGNNLKDKPYADLYGRLTTKSNAFTVHVRAQALRKANNPDPSYAGKWVSGKDQVVAEYRGSTIIERYIDANDPLLPNFATLVASDPSNPALNIDQYYKFRVVSNKRFAP